MRKVVALAGLLAMGFLGTAGCGAGGTLVNIKQSSYTPMLDAPNLSAYKGKVIVFTSVTNEANNTSIWDYYSTDKKYYYEATPALQTYVWDCFVKAFTRIGVRALPSAGGPGTEKAKELTIVLNSMTDEKFVFTVNLSTLGEAPLRKQFTVEAAPTQSTDLKELEMRSYRLIDSAFLTMVTDNEFRKTFLKN